MKEVSNVLTENIKSKEFSLKNIPNLSKEDI